MLVLFLMLVAGQGSTPFVQESPKKVYASRMNANHDKDKKNQSDEDRNTNLIVAPEVKKVGLELDHVLISSYVKAAE